MVVYHHSIVIVRFALIPYRILDQVTHASYLVSHYHATSPQKYVHKEISALISLTNIVHRYNRCNIHISILYISYNLYIS